MTVMLSTPTVIQFFHRISNIDLALSRVLKIYMVLAVEAHIEKLYLSTIVFDSLFYAGLYKEFFLYLLLVNSSSFENFGY